MGLEMDRMSEAGKRMQTREWTFGARLPVWRREIWGTRCAVSCQGDAVCGRVMCLL